MTQTRAQKVLDRITAFGKRSPIQEVLEKQLVFCAFQPVVDLKTGKIFAYEALARSKSQHFDGPLPLFAAAIEEKLCGQLGRLLRQLAIENCADYPLLLNVHPNEFAEGWLVRPDDPIFWHEKQLYIEITESVPISHFEMCNSVLKEVRSKNVGLAVDDLGAGYSNLKYISDLTPEIVKLDRELIAGLRPGTRQFTLVEGMVQLCTKLGAKVVAEGIETAEELGACMKAGAHFGQGYFLARPAFPKPTVDWAAALTAVTGH